MKNLVIMFFVFLSAIAYAQDTLKGRVTDPSDEPVPFALVAAKNFKTNEVICSGISDLDGYFELKCMLQDEFVIFVSVMGFQTYSSAPLEFQMDDEAYKQHFIQLEYAENELEEVIITAVKPLLENKQDRIVLNINDRIAFAGSTVLEVLEKSPVVSVNRLGKSLTLYGKEGVVIMINGKQTNLPVETVYEMISSMNADRVEKIEVIHSPPAGMDASGSAGIINIVTKSDVDLGSKGTITINTGFGLYPKAGGNLSLFHRKNAFSFFLDYAYLYDKTWQRFLNERNVLQNGINVNTSTLNDRSATRESHHFSTGTEIKLSGSSSVGLQFSGNPQRWKLSSENLIDIVEDDELKENIFVVCKERNAWDSFVASIYWNTQLGESTGFQFHFDRLFYYNVNPSSYVNHFFVQESETIQNVSISKKTPIDMYVAKFDVNQSVSEKVKIDAGIKFLQSSLENTVKLDSDKPELIQIDDDVSGIFNLDEQIRAAYISSQSILEKDINLSVGLRWEHTRTILVNDEDHFLVNRNYHDLFPTLSVRKGWSNGYSAQFSTGRRIFRPTYNQLAPFVIFLDPLSFISGNTQLKPSYTNYVNAGLTVFHDYTFQFSYSREKDHIVPWQILTQAENNVQLAFPNNVDRVNTFSSSLNFPMHVSSWWDIDNSFLFNIQQSETLFQDAKLRMKNRNFQAVSNHMFRLSNGWKAELSVMYRSKALMGIGLQQPMGSVGLGVQKELKNEHGTIRCNVTDVFKTMIYGFTYQQPEIGLDHRFQMLYEMRVFNLSYTKNFGNKKLSNLRKAQSPTEEQNRVGNQ
ncbi:MAG: TonB-dependent receptor [Cyclobacteriaceae bacterium]|nr:TonB-dependent receptor [Cyclobacteriaceae bacterium]